MQPFLNNRNYVSTWLVPSHRLFRTLFGLSNTLALSVQRIVSNDLLPFFFASFFLSLSLPHSVSLSFCPFRFEYSLRSLNCDADNEYRVRGKRAPGLKIFSSSSLQWMRGIKRIPSISTRWQWHFNVCTCVSFGSEGSYESGSRDVCGMRRARIRGGYFVCPVGLCWRWWVWGTLRVYCIYSLNTSERALV